MESGLKIAMDIFVRHLEEYEERLDKLETRINKLQVEMMENEKHTV